MGSSSLVFSPPCTHYNSHLHLPNGLLSYTSHAVFCMTKSNILRYLSVLESIKGAYSEHDRPEKSKTNSQVLMDRKGHITKASSRPLLHTRGMIAKWKYCDRLLRW